MDFIIFSASEPVSADCVRVGTGGPSASSAAADEEDIAVVALIAFLLRVVLN